MFCVCMCVYVCARAHAQTRACIYAHIYVHTKLKKLTYINNICIPINIHYLVCNICLSDKNDHNIYIYIVYTKTPTYTQEEFTDYRISWL